MSAWQGQGKASRKATGYATGYRLQATGYAIRAGSGQGYRIRLQDQATGQAADQATGKGKGKGKGKATGSGSAGRARLRCNATGYRAGLQGKRSGSIRAGQGIDQGGTDQAGRAGQGKGCGWDAEGMRRGIY